MKIHGLAKMTLLDFPGKVACTVFLGKCDFRCPYCHNFELVDGSAPPVLDKEDLMTFLSRRQGLLDGVAVTGGEPCLNRDLPDLLSEIRAMGFMTKLDTNGNHPAMLKEILDRGLVDYVAMDIKNSPGKYAMTVGRDKLDLDPILASIALLKEGQVDYEFRTTVVDEFHQAEDFEEMGRMIAGAKRYFLQSFTDRESVPYANLHAPSSEKMQEYVEIARKYVKESSLRGTDL